MEEQSVDRRVRKTKRQLRKALMDLMAEKPVKSISVRELADRADINRGTFYMTELYRFAQDNADLCQILLGPNGDRGYTERICTILRSDFLRDFLSRFYTGSSDRLDYFCSFIVSGNLTLTLEWLTSGMKETPEEMATLAGSMIMNGVRAL